MIDVTFELHISEKTRFEECRKEYRGYLVIEEPRERTVGILVLLFSSRKDASLFALSLSLKQYYIHKVLSWSIMVDGFPVQE